MRSFFSKPVIAILVILAVLCIGVLVFFGLRGGKPEPLPPKPAKDLSTLPEYKVIGTSVAGLKIESYTYRSGQEDTDTKVQKNLVFVGGMHGGYEWNSVLLAYQFKDYLDKNPAVIPAGISVTIIPSLNPDGVFAVTGKKGRFTVADVSTDKKILESGRFNARGVDLNRNFDCNWQAKSMWRAKQVSGGTAAFSEPEAKALRDFALENKPDAFIFWHSQSNAVYASECHDGILPATLDIMNAYAKASGYPAVKTFDSYKITGDSEGWLASINIPAITVELKTHETTEWEKNLAGVKALFAYFGSRQ